MRILILLIILLISSSSNQKPDDRLSTIDFVQVLNGNKAEAMYYYKKNWKVLRDLAVDQGYIHSYQLLEAPYSESEPFHLILITTYSNQKEYDIREEHFAELIEDMGAVKLLNDKKPEKFRKVLFGKDKVRHWY